MMSVLTFLHESVCASHISMSTLSHFTAVCGATWSVQWHFSDTVACTGVLKSVCVWFASFRAVCNEANSLSCFGSTHVFWGEIELHVCFGVSKVNYGGKALRDEINEKSAALLSVSGCSWLFASPVFGKFCYWGQQVLLMPIIVSFLSLITDELLFFIYVIFFPELHRWDLQMML